MHENPTPGLRKLFAKADRLIAERRVRLLVANEIYLVEGDTGTYYVAAGVDGIVCPCRARTEMCSHAIAVAAIRGAKRAETNGDSLTEAVA